MITTDKIRYNIGEYLWNYWQNNNNIESIRNAEKTLRNEIEIGLRIRFKDFCPDELVRDLFNGGQYAWNKDNTEMVGFVGNEPVLVRQETYNKLLVRFLGGVWCPKVVENWVRTVERNKNKDIENVNDSYMFGVIENDRKHKSSDFHVSFYYRG